MINTLKTIILFIFLLTLIISIHEFGHFLACKIFNVYVAEFSIGMGKLLYSHKGKETTFSIRMLPIGGFCAMVGDNQNDLESTPNVDETEVPYERTLTGVAKWKKIIILLSGVFMNLLLALVLVAGVYLYNGAATKAPPAVVNSVQENSPADLAGLEKDDEIIKCAFSNGYTIKPADFFELSDFLILYEEGEITFTIKRDGEILTINLTPTYSEEKSTYIVGITSYEASVEEINLANCFVYAYNYLHEMVQLIITTTIGLFRGVNTDQISGPIGIYNVTSTAVSYGYLTYVLLIAIISLNIGMFNLFPLPVLDGGRIVLTLIEAIIKKPIPKKVESLIMSASVALFMMLLIYATSQDILRLFK